MRSDVSNDVAMSHYVTIGRWGQGRELPAWRTALVPFLDGRNLRVQYTSYVTTQNDYAASK